MSQEPLRPGRGVANPVYLPRPTLGQRLASLFSVAVVGAVGFTLVLGYTLWRGSPDRKGELVCDAAAGTCTGWVGVDAGRQLELGGQTLTSLSYERAYGRDFAQVFVDYRSVRCQKGRPMRVRTVELTCTTIEPERLEVAIRRVA